MAQGKKAPRAPVSMADRDGWIWYDGKLVPWREATTHVLTHSLHYGLAVFEGVRAYKTAIGTAIFRLKEHTDRLFASAHIYMMKLPFTRERLIEAQLEVTQHGYDEGLLLDVDGFVAEGAGENIFIVKDGPIWEPELTSALTGITRSSVIELATELGYEVRAKRLTRDDVYNADEAFFTGTAAEVTPIRELDGRQIGAGKAGPITKAIQKAFFDVVTGKDQKRRQWLTPVKGKAK